MTDRQSGDRTRRDVRALASEVTRAVPLFQAQTVSRRVHDPQPQLPVTRAYPAGTFERLRPALHAARTSRAAALTAPSRAALPTALCIAAALGAFVVRSEPKPAARVPAAGAGRGAAAAHVAAAAPPLPARSSSAAPPAPAVGATPSPRAAAEALARGDDHAALVAYRALASAHPGRPVFAHVTAVLERRLADGCSRPDTAAAAPCLHEDS